jgi:hypothetical protein
VGITSYAGPLLEGFAVDDIIDLKGIASTGSSLNDSTVSGDLQSAGSSGTVRATTGFSEFEPWQW